jgi:immunity protein 26 of polymorphic toxin system
MSVSYSEGDWFAVPLPGGGYEAVVIARMAPNNTGLLLGYFFGPRTTSEPGVDSIQRLSPESAAMVRLFADSYIERGQWPIMGGRKAGFGKTGPCQSLFAGQRWGRKPLWSAVQMTTRASLCLRQLCVTRRRCPPMLFRRLYSAQHWPRNSWRKESRILDQLTSTGYSPVDDRCRRFVYADPRHGRRRYTICRCLRPARFGRS